jgi:4a-hydroxytetrahydrobiopterin dehydratase
LPYREDERRSDSEAERTVMKLSEQTCRPVKAGDSALSGKEVTDRMFEIPQWSLTDNSLQREFRFKDFRKAMEFVDAVAGVANEQDHHPDISISYNKVRLTLTTHKIGGLSLNDFIVAAKIDLLAL